MFNAIRTHALRWLRVPHDPDPPAGAPGSLTIFRAGRNFYYLRLVRWGIGQLGALGGIIFSVTMLAQFEAAIEASRAAATSPSTVASPAAPTAQALTPGGNAGAGAETIQKTKRPRREPGARARGAMQRLAERTPGWVVVLLRIAEAIGIVVYLAQIPLTYAIVRLDFELRWYMVTDRSLRIRSGITSVQESTMSFANIQQVVVSQGPLQRLLGLADVRVQSAGGGGGGEGQGQHGGHDSLHTGIFHGVENANQIRDTILDRLRRFREAGLGDPDDRRTAAPLAAGSETLDAALAAAREVVAEARALRQSVQS
jgi:hypothetical protein